MSRFDISEEIDPSTETTVNVNQSGGAIAVGRMIQNGVDDNTCIIYQTTGLIAKGDDRNERAGTRIKLRRIEIILQAFLAERDPSGAQSFAVPCTVYIIKDKQNNNTPANEVDVTLLKMFEGNANIQTEFLDFDERNRFSLVYKDTFTVTGTQGLAVAQDEECARVIKTCVIPTTQAIQYDHLTATGESGTIGSETLWTIIAFATNNDKFNLVVKANNRVYYTEM